MSSSSLVSERLVSFPLRKSSYVRISQNCGVTASRGRAATSGSNQRVFFIYLVSGLHCEIERSLPLNHIFRLRKFVFANGGARKTGNTSAGRPVGTDQGSHRRRHR